MTKKKTNKQDSVNEDNAYHKLSIQVGLNGLSFCVLDTIGQELSHSFRIRFPKEISPYDLQKELRDHMREEGVLEYSYSEVVAIHRNSLFSLVPQAFFDEHQLSHYLKFNAKIYPTDHLEYDWVEGLEAANVYVPFTNVNNYLFDQFGEFEFKHSGTVLLETLQKLPSSAQGTVCFAHLSEAQLDLAIFRNKKLQYFNSFFCQTPEDFMYYLLFALEQLNIAPEEVKLRLLGEPEEGDPVYELASSYIDHLSVFLPSEQQFPLNTADESIDFTLIGSL